MAQVVRDPQLEARIERYLAGLMRTWESVPFDAQVWDERDELSRLTYVSNWPVSEDQLRLLQGWAEQGLLTPAQRERYDELLQLVVRYRPVLDELLRED